MLLKLVFFLPLLLLTSAIDRTILPEQYDEDVVCEVINKIDDAAIFPDDKKMLRRIAYVESKFGEDLDTYRDTYHGGIWRVDETGFDDIKNGMHTELDEVWPKVEKLLSKQREDITWDDLRKPLFSGVLARLKLYTVNASIPADRKNQAQYWKKYYNSEKLTILNDFTNKTDTLIKDFGSDCNMCRGKMNLVIVMDGSNSIGNEDYKKGKRTAVNLIKTYSGESVRIGYVLFSNTAEVVFDGFQRNFTEAEMSKKISNSKYPKKNTNTHLGINQAVTLLRTNPNDVKGVPNVIVVFTDGQPTNKRLTAIAAKRAKKFDISIIGVGIGKKAVKAILQAMTIHASHVVSVNSYADLTHIFGKINSKTCKVPQTPDICEKVGNDPLGKNEKRYFKFLLPCDDGLTIKIGNCDGKTQGYYSYDYPNPSSAVNDGTFGKEVFIASRKKTRYVYVTVQGRRDNNVWSLHSSEGNHLGEDHLCQDDTCDDNFCVNCSETDILCRDRSGVSGDNVEGDNLYGDQFSRDSLRDSRFEKDDL